MTNFRLNEVSQLPLYVIVCKANHAFLDMVIEICLLFFSSLIVKHEVQDLEAFFKVLALAVGTI